MITLTKETYFLSEVFKNIGEGDRKRLFVLFDIVTKNEYMAVKSGETYYIRSIRANSMIASLRELADFYDGIDDRWQKVTDLQENNLITIDRLIGDSVWNVLQEFRGRNKYETQVKLREKEYYYANS